ncbi:hypothetical protein PBY51_017404 [Eleginops maclovinus]|uniref:Uncharacterized protein n=1 Tax=Eleginops maclovinus TaxID=56733 RepID=A0AAN7XJN7_ELEMC|nr:hypothetical protein PBY51_017404 [Eleginops maclovinus]
MLMKEEITRETHPPVSPRRGRQHCVDHENGLVSFRSEAIVLTQGGNPIPANKERYIKDDAVFRGSA